MPAQTVKELLAAQSATKLQAMEDAIEKQIGTLKLEKSWIGDALIEKGVRSKPNGRPEAAPKKGRKARTGRTGSSAVIREIVRAQPERIWMPKEIIDAAHKRGVGSTDQAIRVALRRMGEQGFLQRGPNGEGWRLASSNSSAQESFDEAQTSKTSHPIASPAGGGENAG